MPLLLKLGTICMLSIAMQLSACVAPRPSGGDLVETRLTIDREALSVIKQQGPYGFSGQAFLRTRGGDVRTCAGSQVVLIASTPYSDERIQLLYGGTIKGFHPIGLRQKQILNDPPDYPDYWRTTTCDASGNFSFSNLVAGNFYLLTQVTWQTATPSHEGGMLMQRVTVNSSAERVIITQ